MVSPDNNRIVRNPSGKSSAWKHFGFSTSEDGTPVKDKAVCRLFYLQFHIVRIQQIFVSIWNDTIEANTQYC